MQLAHIRLHLAPGKAQSDAYKLHLLPTQTLTRCGNGGQMASVKPLGDKWRAAVQRHGIRRTKVFSSKRDAARWALVQEAELDSLKQSGGRSFGAACALYLETVTPLKRSVRWETNALRRLQEQIGATVRLADIDSAAIAAWRNARLKTVSGSTVQRDANLLRNIFRVARDEWRWIDHNPFQGVKLPKHNEPRKQVWTWRLIRRVLSADRTGKTLDVIKAFRVALHTGLRLQEALTGRYDPATRVYTLPVTKAGKVQKVPVIKRAARILPVTYSVDTSTMTREDIRRWSNEASTLFSKLCRELLIDGLTFHDARASALTWLSRRVDVLTLSRISRHKDLRLLSNVYYRESAEQIAARI